MKILFWAVDCQRDFMNSDGALYVQDAENIKPNLKKLTELAKEHKIQVVNTADWHFYFSKEISDKPDFMNTFPRHCMAGTKGSLLIDETKPEIVPIYVDWRRNFLDNTEEIKNSSNIIIFKDAFDVFTGNKYTEKILNLLNPNLVIVYGVATNVCVNCAVLGLVKRGYKVVVVKDAIKELPNLPVDEIYEDWKNKGVQLEVADNIEKLINLPLYRVE